MDSSDKDIDYSDSQEIKKKDYKETVVYINEKYNEEYLQNKIQEARERLKNDQLATSIIKEVVEQKYKNGYIGYAIRGYCIVRDDWEYESDGTFLIKEDEIDVIKEKKAEIYMYPKDEYAVGTSFDLII